MLIQEYSLFRWLKKLWVNESHFEIRKIVVKAAPLLCTITTRNVFNTRVYYSVDDKFQSDFSATEGTPNFRASEIDSKPVITQEKDGIDGFAVVSNLPTYSIREHFGSKRPGRFRRRSKRLLLSDLEFLLKIENRIAKPLGNNIVFSLSSIFDDRWKTQISSHLFVVALLLIII